MDKLIVDVNVSLEFLFGFEGKAGRQGRRGGEGRREVRGEREGRRGDLERTRDLWDLEGVE